MPVAATFSIGLLLATITFDQPLQGGLSAIGNWLLQANIGAGTRRFTPFLAPVIAGLNVSFQGVDAGAALPGDVVAYNAVPPDVVGLVGGLAAGAFAGFPVTVIP